MPYRGKSFVICSKKIAQATFEGRSSIKQKGAPSIAGEQGNEVLFITV